ncbi:hypothetical protein ACWDUD_08245 [Rhodococcus sp. NPDC003382]
MSIPLSLGMPPSREEPRGLLDALLTHRAPAPADVPARFLAPRIVTAADAEAAGDVVVELDAGAEAPAPGSRRPLRYQIDCAPEYLDDILAFTAPAPLCVYVTGDTLADTARRLTEAGHVPGLPAGRSADEIADFLAVLAHSDTGYVAQARDAAEVLALLSATAAALSGFDVRQAVAEPDAARLAALVPEAAAAVREILLTVEVDDPAAIVAGLAGLGLTR